MRIALLRGLVVAGVLLGCRRDKPATEPAPVAAPPPAPPAPCDLIGTWEAQPALPLGPQQVVISPGSKPGMYMVRGKNGANMGVATMSGSTAVPVDTAVTDPVYKCQVSATDCNAMTCAFMGGAAPATFKRLQ